MSKKKNKNKNIRTTARTNDRVEPKKPRVNPNQLTVKLVLDSKNLNDELIDEILEVLETCQFSKISIPLGTYRNLIINDSAADDNRVSTIGYIRDYNAETQEFTVVVFNNFIDAIKSWGEVGIELQYLTYKGKLGTITKLNIIPVTSEIEEEEEDDDIEAVALDEADYAGPAVEVGDVYDDTEADVDSAYEEDEDANVGAMPSDFECVDCKLS